MPKKKISKIDEKVNARIAEGIKLGFNQLFERIENLIHERVD